MSTKQWSRRIMKQSGLSIMFVLVGVLTVGPNQRVKAAPDADICKGPDEWPLDRDKVARKIAIACNNIIIKKEVDRNQLARAYNLLAITAGFMGLNKGVVSMMSKAIELDPNQSVYFHNRALYILSNDDDADRALADAQTANRLDQMKVGPLLIAGRAKSRLGKDYQALSYFKQAVSLNDKHPDPYIKIGKLYLGDGQPRKALPHFIRSEDLAKRRAWGSEDKDWVLFFENESISGQCRALAALNDSRADSICNAALRQNPKSINANFGKGLIYSSKHDDVNALKHFDAAKQGDPYFADAIVARGTIFERGGELARAQVEYERAIERRPMRAWAYIARAGLLHNQGKYDKAKQDLMKAVEVQPQLPQAHIALAAYHQKQNETAEAIKNYEHALALDSQNSEASSALAVLRSSPR